MFFKSISKCSKEMKIYKWPDSPHLFSPIDCSVSINNETYGLFNGDSRHEISPQIINFFLFFIENLNLECIKTAVFDTKHPKSPYRGRGASLPPTPNPCSVISLPR